MHSVPLGDAQYSSGSSVSRAIVKLEEVQRWVIRMIKGMELLN